MTRPAGGGALYRLFADLGWALGVVLACLSVVAAGALVPLHGRLVVLFSAGVLLLGMTALEPAVIPLIAMTGVIVVHRVYLPGADLSVSDLLLFVAVWPALVFARRGYSPPMRKLLWLAAIYQLCTLFAVIANPYRANMIDWFHNWLLLAGALVVGWAVGRQGYARLGLTVLMVLMSVLALSTVAQGLYEYARGNFSPIYTAWPYSMHKNFVGTTLAAGALIAYIHPPWTGWSRGGALAVFWLCATGIVFSQSRQAIIAMTITLAFIVLRRDPDRSRSKVVLVTFAPLAALTALTVMAQYQSGNQFNSVRQRFSFIGDAMQVWRHEPLFGAGLRWWYTYRFPVRSQPPNAEVEALSTTGVVGLLALIALMVGCMVVLIRIDPRYGTLAVALVLTRFIEGQLDIFWVSVTTSLPFLVTGVCLGVQAREAEEPATGAPLDRTHEAVHPG